jgi:aldose 1-epimerase
MSFYVFSKKDNGFEQVVLKNKDSGTEAVILPHHGASLHAFSINTGSGFLNCIDNYTDAQNLETELKSSYKSSKLSPFVCRIPGGTYYYLGERFEFKNKFPDGSAIHGLLFDKPFEIIKKSSGDEQASVILNYNYEKDDYGYPFNYSCNITYTLLPSDTLKIETRVFNPGNTTLPIADGWHPYFKLGGKVDEWRLQFRSRLMLEFDEKLIPTGKLMPYDRFNKESSLQNVELDNCFLLEMDQNSAACTLLNPVNKVSVSLFPSESYPYLQIYTPDHRKSIAIENLSSPPDSFNNKIGLVLLAPGDTKNFTISYKLNTG